MTATLVTVAIPIYKRLTTLAQAVKCIAAQEYPNIELIVSDNGMNGTKVKDIVEQCYPYAFRFRQNPITVPISPHYNQLIEAASGEYCVVLDDDDTLSPNFVSELAGILDYDPNVVVALARQEVVDAVGKILGRSSDNLPRVLSGEEFICSWTAYGFACYTAMLGRTALMRKLGGYENFPRGTHADDAMLIKLCLSGSVAFGQHSTFRWRVNETSYGWSMSSGELAEDTRQFLHFLDANPTVTAYAAHHPKQWGKLKPRLLHMGWHTYFERWDTIYRQRMPYWEWMKAAFAMPYIAEYYKAVRAALWYRTKEAMFVEFKLHLPWAKTLYRRLAGCLKRSSE